MSEHQEKLDPNSEEAQQLRLAELEKVEVPADVNLLLLWDTLSHCNEPGDGQIVLEQLGHESEEVALEKKAKKEAEEEHANGKYRVKFDGRSFPEKHSTWPEAFQLHVNEDEGTFYVLKSKDDKPDDDDAVYPTEFVAGDQKTRIGYFGLHYSCGNKARDKDGNLVGEENGEIRFNYAEHKMLGEMLVLRWTPTKTTTGMYEIKLPNGVKLSYGEINGLGGDFFGGYNPVSSGKNFDEQCKNFIEAFDTLGRSGKALNEVKNLREGREEEVKAIAEAVKQGKSTFEAYKGLKQDSFVPGMSKEDLKAVKDTMSGEGPSYLRLAQINLDHFGKDAIKAYNAGHYCALKKAAEGDLETAYGMNAFADHYLGDCFASGHYRTPRRTLHGSETAFGAAWAAISGVVGKIASGDLLGFYKGVMKVMAPDLCAMLMHNEDNKLGITVKNKKGEEFSCWGDKQMFEPQNAKNKEMMRQSLQASVNEVYEAFEKKKAKRPEEGYTPWDYAPSEVLAGKTHSPLFIEYEPSWYHPTYWGVKVREPFDDIHTTKYVEVGGSSNLIDLYNKISTSELWKTY